MGTEERLQSSEEVLAEILKIQEQLHIKLTDQESRSRRENVRIYGVPEVAEGSPKAMIPFIEKLLKENLGISTSTDLKIERAHQAPVPQPPSDAHPRSILVRFLSFITKEDVIRLAWQKKGFLFRNKKISLDHDYAPGILNKRREFGEARRVLKLHKIRFQMLFLAHQRVFYEDGTTIYESVEEATEDIERRGMQVKVVTQPTSLLEKIQQGAW